MKQLLSIMLIASCMSLFAIAQSGIKYVPATPNPITKVQPDGDSITYRLFGDENYSYMTTMDGFVIIENSKGYICYAKINCKGNLISSNIKVHNQGNRTKKEKRYVEKMKKNKKLYKGEL